MKAGRIVMIVIGALIALVGFGMVVGGAGALVGYGTHRDADGFFRTPLGPAWPALPTPSSPTTST